MCMGMSPLTGYYYTCCAHVHVFFIHIYCIYFTFKYIWNITVNIISVSYSMQRGDNGLFRPSLPPCCTINYSRFTRIVILYIILYRGVFDVGTFDSTPSSRSHWILQSIVSNLRLFCFFNFTDFLRYNYLYRINDRVTVRVRMLKLSLNLCNWNKLNNVRKKTCVSSKQQFNHKMLLETIDWTSWNLLYNPNTSLVDHLKRYRLTHYDMYLIFV